MKITKLSLAAALAVGALTTVASAAPLEDVIKNAEINGYMRWRYTYDSQKNSPKYMFGEETGNQGGGVPNVLPPFENLENKVKGKRAVAVNNFKSIIDLNFGIDDNFYANIGTEIAWTDAAKSNPDTPDPNNYYQVPGKKPYAETEGTFQTKRMFLGYKNGGTDVRLGRDYIGSIFTDTMVGDGIKVINKDIDGLTLVAAAFNNVSDTEEIGFHNLIADEEGYEKAQNIVNKNMYNLGVVGSYEPFNFQLWSTTISNVASLFALDLNKDYAIDENLGFGFHGQYVNSALKSKFKDEIAGFEYTTKNADGVEQDIKAGNTNWWLIQGGANAYGLDFTLGYIGYSVSGDGIGMVAIDDDGQLINPTEQLLGWSLVTGRANYVYTGLGYSFLDDKVRIGGDYIYGKAKFAGISYDQWETIARLNYNHSKNLQFKTWYSWMQDGLVNGSGNPKYKSQRYRFEAKYSF